MLEQVRQQLNDARAKQLKEADRKRVYLKVLPEPASGQADQEEQKAITAERVSPSRRDTLEYYTIMLDKQKHCFSVESFLVEVLHRTGISEKAGKDLRIWLAPNHRLIDLSPIDEDDMLVIGT